MSNLGYRLFCIGSIGAIISAMALDSTWWIASLVALCVFAIIGAIGYMTMDIDEVLSDLEPKSSKELKSKNREETFQTWLKIEMKKGFWC